MASKQEEKCRKKVRYESKLAANFFAHGDGLRAYPCPVCKGWHLTSQQVDKGKKHWKQFE